MSDPVSAEPLLPGASPTPWATVCGHLERSTATYWVATARPDGAPHVMPVLAVWVDRAVFFSAGGKTRKAKNLAGDPRCVLTVEHDPFDLVVEGVAAKVRDGATVERVARAYASVYGWHVTVREGAFLHATGGAPTAGPPPYDAYELSPAKALAYAIDEAMSFVPTRWRF
jgi:hypothetical protein